MAWDRTSKHIHAQIYSNAKATSAQKFLREFVKTAPYVIRSIQVDGGSEFMAEFETECARIEYPAYRPTTLKTPNITAASNAPIAPSERTSMTTPKSSQTASAHYALS